MDDFILIVDDNIENLKVLGNILKKQGYKIAIAKSGSEALQILDNIRPSLILLDVMMPEMDGFEVCRIIKNDKRFSEIAIIFLTAKNDTQDILDGFNAGGIDYITKPFNPYELLARVKNQIDIFVSREIIKNQTIELDKLNKTKDKIFSLISHDVRTPLSTLKMSIQYLEKIDLNSNRKFVLNMIKLVEASADEAYYMLDNLLNWSKNQMGKIVCHPVIFDINETINKNVRLYDFALKQKGLKLHIEAPSEVIVNADEEMINTVFRNFLNNAIKFSYPNGEIKIAIIKRKDAIQLSIADKGCGMNEQAKQIIFSENDYTTTPGTQGEKGTGIGMKICKQFIEMNGGKIWVESAEGKGSTFYFSLPVKKGK